MNPKTVVLLIVGVALLAGLFVAFRPAPEAPSAAGPTPTTAAPAIVPAVAAELTVELQVRDGKRLSGPQRIQARQGQELRLRVTSDRADELHLHGYDRTLKLAAGVPAELRLDLNLSGRFEIELHHAHGTLTVLEVQPGSP